MEGFKMDWKMGDTEDLKNWIEKLAGASSERKADLSELKVGLNRMQVTLDSMQKQLNNIERILETVKD